MTSGDQREAGMNDGLLRDRPDDPLRGTWVSDEVQHALARVDALTRELEHVETALRSQSEEVARLQDRSFSEIAEATTGNFFKLFNINK